MTIPEALFILALALLAHLADKSINKEIHDDR